MATAVLNEDRGTWLNIAKVVGVLSLVAIGLLFVVHALA